jgi:RNA-directed DNA polymerase
MKLVKQAKIFGSKHDKVLREQYVLAMSYEFRIVAIYNLINSLGSNSPGIDNKTITKSSTNYEKIKLVEEIRNYVRQGDGYKASPVKRIYIPKINGKLRPLGIPNISDRGLQHLIKLVLEPLIEMNSDIHNFGFRKYRTAKNAIGILRAQFRSNEFETENK